MQILDGVFQSDDMGISVIVDLVNNSGKSSGFTASGRSGDQYQSTFALIQIHYGFRHTQFFRRGHHGTHQTECQCHRASLFIGIDTVTSTVGDGE